MTVLLCPAANCRTLGQHTTGCEDVACCGCIPRQADPGLQLCDYHTARIGTLAQRCSELYGELEAVLAAPERPGQHTSGTPDHGTNLNERAVAMRTEIRHVLVSWALMIGEERGIATPDNTVPAIGAYLDLHRMWLAAHPTAKDCVDELADLSRRAWNVAYPSGSRVFPVGPCPAPGCTGTVRAVLRQSDSLLPSEVRCDAEHTDCECGMCPPHAWPAHRWRELGRHRYVTAAEIAQDWGVPVGTVHRLASVHQWRRTEDGRRPTLYWRDDVSATRRDREWSMA